MHVGFVGVTQEIDAGECAEEVCNIQEVVWLGELKVLNLALKTCIQPYGIHGVLDEGSHVHGSEDLATNRP